MKKTDRWILILLGLIVLTAALWLTQDRRTDNVPFDSRSSGAYGTRAFYLLLEESGFHVTRKDGPMEEIPNGVVLVFGKTHLAPETPEEILDFENAGNLYLVIENPYQFTNEYLRQDPSDAVRLLHSLWSYRDQTIWFDEYGRNFNASYSEQATALSLLPPWLTSAGQMLLLVGLLCLLFWRQPVGPRRKPVELFQKKAEMEEVWALSRLMEKADLPADAALLYYRTVCAQTGRDDPEWMPLFEALHASDDANMRSYLPLMRRADALWRDGRG